jgi:sporulation protein YlmC with PRC-barrel domain
MHNKEIIGLKVITSDGWTIGTVNDVATDPADWRITSLEVNVSAHAADSGTMAAVSERLVNATTRLGSNPPPADQPSSPSASSSLSPSRPQSDRLFITPSQIEGVVDKVTLKVTRGELLLSSPESTVVSGPAPSMPSPATPGAY